MKPKAKTLIERHGFIDPDRKESLHDKIQIWAYKNIQLILRSLSSSDKEFRITYASMERPIVQHERNYSAVIGFVDLYVSASVYQGDKLCRTIYVSLEIKSNIESCGDLIRQINFYRNFESFKSTWIVVSPDDRFREILLDQGIYFYKYQDPEQLF